MATDNLTQKAPYLDNGWDREWPDIRRESLNLGGLAGTTSRPLFGRFAHIAAASKLPYAGPFLVPKSPILGEADTMRGKSVAKCLLALELSKGMALAKARAS